MSQMSVASLSYKVWDLSLGHKVWNLGLVFGVGILRRYSRRLRRELLPGMSEGAEAMMFPPLTQQVTEAVNFTIVLPSLAPF